MYNQINVDLQESLKNGDKFRLSVLRMLKSALQLDSINNKRELTNGCSRESSKGNRYN